jgi:MFS transporter, OFA family, oxalate/formate antiporter
MTSAQTATGSDNRRWLQIAFGVVCMVAAANIQYAWTLFVPEIQKTFKWSEASVQVIFTVFVLLQTWLTPLEGYLIDRYGPRRIVLFGGFLTGLAWVLYSYATTLPMFYGAAAVAGVGVGCVYATCVNNAIKWFPDRRGLAVGLIAGAYGAGSAATIIPISRMIESSGFQSAFFWFGILQGAVILIAALGIKAPQAGQLPQSTTVQQTRYDYTLGQAMQTPVFYVMFVMFILTVTGGLMAVAQLKPMANSFGVSKQEVNLGFVAINALNFALLLDRILNGFSRPFFGFISDKIGREKTMFLAFTLEGFGILALAHFGTTPWAFILLSGLVFLAWGEVYSLFSATAADAFGAKNIGSIYGTLYTAKGFAALLVPVASMIKEWSGSWSTVLYIVACMDLLAAISAILVLRPLMKRHLERTARVYANSPATTGTAISSDLVLAQLQGEAAGLRAQVYGPAAAGQARSQSIDAVRAEIVQLRERFARA